jgi:prepilin-type processing-associated H-X9-DG protein
MALSGGYTEYPVSYLYNADLTDDSKLSQLNSPTQTVLLCEGTSYGDITSNPERGISYSGGAGNANYTEALNQASLGGYSQMETGVLGGYATWQAISTSIAGPIVGRHTNGSNFLLTDGHVKWLRPTLISIGEPAPTTTTPQGTDAAGTQASNPSWSATFSPI